MKPVPVLYTSTNSVYRTGILYVPVYSATRNFKFSKSFKFFKKSLRNRHGDEHKHHRYYGILWQRGVDYKDYKLEKGALPYVL